MRRSLRVPSLVMASCLGAATGLHTFQKTVQPAESVANVVRESGRERPNNTLQQPHKDERPVWSASFWGECYTGCGDKPVHMRTVECYDMWTGEKISWHKCDYASRMPATQEECSCEDGCYEIPDGGCPEDLGTSGEPPNQGWREVGCFEWNSYPVDRYEDEVLAKFPAYHPDFEMACYRYKGKYPCLGGLPFYKYSIPHVPMSPRHCYGFCIQKGMDVFGVENGEVCRCGVSAVNHNFWEEQGVMKKDGDSVTHDTRHEWKAMQFHPTNMPPSGAWPCPMKVYAYGGFYEEEGIPYVYTEEDEADEMYQDGLVTGTVEYSFNEEDGPSSAGGAAFSASGSGTYGFNAGGGGFAGGYASGGYAVLPNLPHVPGDPDSGVSGGTIALDGDFLWGNDGRLTYGFQYNYLDGPRWKQTWCWPERCSPGYQWRHRNQIAPLGRPDTWVEYVRVPVKFDESLSAPLKAVFRDATERIRKSTCVIFEEGDVFENEHEKYVSVGHTKGSLEEFCNVSGMGLPPDPYPYNRFNMGSCTKPNHMGSVLHELLHILGIGDTTTRPDATGVYQRKGPYIIPKWHNLPIWDKQKFIPDYYSYVGAQRERRWQDPLVSNPNFGYAPYDFQSVMHPGNIEEEFETDPVKWNDKVGQRSRLSEGDVDMINDIYRCEILNDISQRTSSTTATTGSTTTWAPQGYGVSGAAGGISGVAGGISGASGVGGVSGASGAGAAGGAAGAAGAGGAGAGGAGAGAAGAAGGGAGGGPVYTGPTTTTTVDPVLIQKLYAGRFFGAWIGALLGWATSLWGPLELNIYGGLLGALVGADTGRYKEQLEEAQSFVQAPQDEQPMRVGYELDHLHN